MRAARLRHKLYVDRPVSSQGDAGDEILTWTQYAWLWAAIEPIRGREQVSGLAALPETDTLIILRWTPQTAAITDKYRFRYKDIRSEIIYNISGPPVHVKLGQREIQFNCQSGVNKG